MGESPPSDPYAIVLADLKAQRAKIDQAISAIEALRGITPSASSDAPVSPGASSGTPTTRAGGPGEFLGLTIVDAAKKLLTRERRQLTNAEIVQAFNAGGLILNSEDKLNTVGSVLNRRFVQVGDVVRVGRGTWGLKEWYPNRSFKATKQGEAKSDSDASAPPPSNPAEDFAGVKLPPGGFAPQELSGFAPEDEETGDL